jgi:autotransporter passenger strand-loop-strand repeat protein
MAEGTLVDNFGSQAVAWCGLIQDTTVSGNGLVNLSAFAHAKNTTLNSSGVEHVEAGGVTDGVTFGGPNALLDLDSADSLTGMVSGFQPSDQIDLRNVKFGAGTSAVFKEGVLTVTDGNTVANLSLMGQYSTAAFKLTDDGHGGTFVNDVATSAYTIGGPITLSISH